VGPGIISKTRATLPLFSRPGPGRYLRLVGRLDEGVQGFV
jgi:hypothetical protein